MAGAYCKFCDHRCFVYRVIPGTGWSGHLATCADGKAHDRDKTGWDSSTAVNPHGLSEQELQTALAEALAAHDAPPRADKP